MKRLVMLAAALWLAVLVSAPVSAETGVETGPIKIGVHVPLSGGNSAGGTAELNGMLLARQQQPSVLGREVQLVILDNASSPVEAAKAVSRLVRGGVVAVLGSYGSSEAVAGGEVTERARIPMLGTSCSNPLVTQGRHFSFRLSFQDGVQAEVLARHAVQALNVRRVVVLTCMENDFSVSLSAYFKRAFTEAGGQVSGEATFRTGSKDFSEQIAMLMDKKPDAVFFSGYSPEGAVFLQQLGPKPPFRILCGDSMDTPGLLQAPDGAAEKIVHAAFPFDPAQAPVFTSQWKAAYPDTAPSATGAVGYTAYTMMLDAIRRAGQTDSVAISKALGATANFSSPLGKLTMDPLHNANTRVGVVEYVGGQRRMKIY